MTPEEFEAIAQKVIGENESNNEKVLYVSGTIAGQTLTDFDILTVNKGNNDIYTIGFPIGSDPNARIIYASKAGIPWSGAEVVQGYQPDFVNTSARCSWNATTHQFTVVAEHSLVVSQVNEDCNGYIFGKAE